MNSRRFHVDNKPEISGLGRPANFCCPAKPARGSAHKKYGICGNSSNFSIYKFTKIPKILVNFTPPEDGTFPILLAGPSPQRGGSNF